jgi:hypothetical protein
LTGHDPGKADSKPGQSQHKTQRLRVASNAPHDESEDDPDRGRVSCR